MANRSIREGNEKKARRKEKRKRREEHRQAQAMGEGGQAVKQERNRVGSLQPEKKELRSLDFTNDDGTKDGEMLTATGTLNDLLHRAEDKHQKHPIAVKPTLVVPVLGDIVGASHIRRRYSKAHLLNQASNTAQPQAQKLPSLQRITEAVAALRVDEEHVGNSIHNLNSRSWDHPGGKENAASVGEAASDTDEDDDDYSSDESSASPKQSRSLPPMSTSFHYGDESDTHEMGRDNPAAQYSMLSPSNRSGFKALLALPEPPEGAPPGPFVVALFLHC